MNIKKITAIESKLSQLKFFDIVGWFTNGKGYQRSNHRIKKRFELYRISEVDIIICYSQEDLLVYEV